MTAMVQIFRRVPRFVDVRRIETAIAAAEARTSGEIRVSVSPFFWGDVRRAAEKAFDRLGMQRTERHNGVLIFIVPSRRAFVVLGDQGIHERAASGFWDRVVAAMTPHFTRRDFTSGVLAGIELVASELERHFPREPSDENELPDSVDVGRGH